MYTALHLSRLHKSLSVIGHRSCDHQREKKKQIFINFKMLNNYIKHALLTYSRMQTKIRLARD